MIPVVCAEMKRRGWIDGDELEETVVLAQSAPGLLAVNMAIYTGRRLRGFKGSLAASFGAVLPSFIIILLIAMFFTGFRENEIVRRIFQGVRPVAVALILVPAVNMARRSCKNIVGVLIALASLLCVAFLKVSPVWVILVTICCSVSLALIRQKR